MKNRIQELRKERNITQVALSTQIGVSQETISAYENEKHDPSLENLIKLSKYLNVSIDYILYLSDCRRPESSDQLSGEEIQLLDMFRQVGRTNRQLVLSYIQGLIDRGRKMNPSR